MAREARTSPILENSEVVVIPNPLDLAFWRKVDGSTLRAELGIAPQDVFLLYSAKYGLSDYNKGGPDLPRIAVTLRQALGGQVRIVVGVAGKPSKPPILEGVHFHFFSNIKSDQEMREVYSAADFTVVPSRVDNFPSVVAESMACETPVAAYSSHGPKEMVDNGKTGVLADPRETDQLARKMAEVLISNSNLTTAMGRQGRMTSIEKWGYNTVGEQYLALYREVVGRLDAPRR